ncbi:MAG: hypothetical protein K9I97_01170 [Cryomorphaceae bacterium]|jgi:hypothetical protein|nr:hypothetical protein [Cryomorphaceae bacterium]
MKTLKYFIVVCCAFFFGTFKAQDTLVTREGNIITAKIIDFSADFTSYISDTNMQEVLMVPSQQFILVKQGNDLLKTYENDTLITKEGLIIPCKVVGIEPDLISFFQYKYRIGDVQTMLKNQTFVLKFSNGTKDRFDETMVVPNSTSSFELGMEDAKIYYKPDVGMIVGEALMGVVHFFIAPAVAGTVIAYVPPTKLSSENNPNNLLLSTDESYKKGYMSVAKKKKRIAGSVGFLSGMTAFWATILIAWNFW